MSRLSTIRHLPPVRSRLPRMARDFLTALALFAVVVGLTGTLTAPDSNFSGAALAGQFVMPTNSMTAPHAVTSASFTTTSASLTRTVDRTQSLLILALVFSSMVAVNLAFLRHLRRVYASPR